MLNVNLRMRRHDLDIVWEGVTPFLSVFNSEVNLRMRTIELYIVSVDATPSLCSFNQFLQLALAQLSLLVLLVSYLLSCLQKITNIMTKDLLGEVVVFF
jgi:hypothetical protein